MKLDLETLASFLSGNGDDELIVQLNDTKSPEGNEAEAFLEGLRLTSEQFDDVDWLATVDADGRPSLWTRVRNAVRKLAIVYLQSRGRAGLCRGNLHSAQVRLESATKLADAIGFPNSYQAWALMTLANVHRLKGSYQEAVAASNRAIEIADVALLRRRQDGYLGRDGDLAYRLLGGAYQELSASYYLLGMPDESISSVRRAGQIVSWRFGEDDPQYLTVLCQHALASWQKGELEQAKYCLETVLSTAKSPFRVERANVELDYAMLLINLEVYDSAREVLDRIEQDLPKKMKPAKRAILRFLRAMVNWGLHERKLAEEGARDAVSWIRANAKDADRNPVVGALTLNLGVLVYHNGRRDEGELLMSKGRDILARCPGAPMAAVITALEKLMKEAGGSDLAYSILPIATTDRASAVLLLVAA
ncbi:MAG: hypothetical protein GX575_33660 [Candidatus Anammoximicrobium sp.]|nr:hypothetical protein [Candidatus Anammoximicrobium sp.]